MPIQNYAEHGAFAPRKIIEALSKLRQWFPWRTLSLKLAFAQVLCQAHHTELQPFDAFQLPSTHERLKAGQEDYGNACQASRNLKPDVSLSLHDGEYRRTNDCRQYDRRYPKPVLSGSKVIGRKIV